MEKDKINAILETLDKKKCKNIRCAPIIFKLILFILHYYCFNRYSNLEFIKLFAYKLQNILYLRWKYILKS